MSGFFSQRYKFSGYCESPECWDVKHSLDNSNSLVRELPNRMHPMCTQEELLQLTFSLPKHTPCKNNTENLMGRWIGGWIVYTGRSMSLDFYVKTESDEKTKLGRRSDIWIP